MSYLGDRSETSLGAQRLIVDVVVSAFASGFAASSLLTIEAVQREGTILFVSVLFVVFPFLFVVSAIAAVLIGIPATIALRSLRMEGIVAYSAVGFVFGTSIAAFAFPSEYRDSLGLYAILGGVPGTIWGSAWWMVRRGAEHG